MENQAAGADNGKRDTVRLILQRWRWPVVMAAALGVCALVLAMVLPPIYTARVTLIPNGEGGTSIISQIASFTNIPIENETSYEGYYGEILHSDRLLNQVIARKWHTSDADSLGLPDFFGLPPVDTEAIGEGRTEFRLKKILRRQVIRFKHDKLNGFMSIEVSVPRDPVLARELADHLVHELDLVVREIKGGQATAQRVFVEDRLAQVEEQLRHSELELTRFVENNRKYSASPALTQRYGELLRESQANSSVWIELRKQLELAKIDEQKGAVRLNILDDAEVPFRSTSPNRPVIVAGGILFGLFLGVLLALSSVPQYLGRRGER